MEELQVWFMSLEPSLQAFWGCALVASAIFLVQTVLSFIGMDQDLDFDTPDFDGDTMDAGGPMSLFSVRFVVNFFVGFGWAGVTFYDRVPSLWMVYAISIVIGLLFGSVFFVLRKNLMKLESSGAYDINEAVGKEATVYLRIPEARQGRGKVQISLGGSIHELPAMTDGPQLASGTHIRVLEVSSDQILLVEQA